MSNNFEERTRLSEERAELELIKLRQEVAELKAKRDSAGAKRNQIERDLQDFRAREADRQANCNHRKGGRNMEGLMGKGTDPMYAVIHHQLPFGEWIVLCQRCQKIWRPGEPGYQEALAYPTDNEPSGSILFTVTKNG